MRNLIKPHKDGSRQLVGCDANVLQRRAEYSDGAELLPGHVSTGRAVRNYRLKADPPFSGGMCHKTDYNNSKSPAISV